MHHGSVFKFIFSKIFPNTPGIDLQKNLKKIDWHIGDVSFRWKWLHFNFLLLYFKIIYCIMDNLVKFQHSLKVLKNASFVWRSESVTQNRQQVVQAQFRARKINY